ncbi:MAG: hypothetical protein H7Z21_02200 [Hymenobacter sp.]|nr:hypothetical protein [Hymenobacter sp.]
MLSDTFYVKNTTNGQVLDRSYITRPAWTGPRSDTLQRDGLTQRHYFSKLFQQLAVDRIDMVGDNNEVLGIHDSTTMALDASVVADRGSMTWIPYQSDRAAKLSLNYHEVLTNFLDSLNGPSNPAGRYWYNAGGLRGASHFRYAEYAPVNRTMDGRRRASPYQYHLAPFRWRFGGNLLTGLQQVLDGRVNEIAVGDTFYNPAVSPGYSDGGFYNIEDDEMMRPGQFLGLLKANAVLGADAYTLFMTHASSIRTQREVMSRPLRP